MEAYTLEPSVMGWADFVPPDFIPPHVIPLDFVPLGFCSPGFCSPQDFIPLVKLLGFGSSSTIYNDVAIRL